MFHQVMRAHLGSIVEAVTSQWAQPAFSSSYDTYAKPMHHAIALLQIFQIQSTTAFNMFSPVEFVLIKDNTGLKGIIMLPFKDGGLSL